MRNEGSPTILLRLADRFALSRPADSGASLSSANVFRVAPHVGLEAGISVALDRTPVEDMRFRRGMHALHGCRWARATSLIPAEALEISAGAGGVYQHYSIQLNPAGRVWMSRDLN